MIPLGTYLLSPWSVKTTTALKVEIIFLLYLHAILLYGRICIFWSLLKTSRSAKAENIPKHKRRFPIIVSSQRNKKNVTMKFAVHVLSCGLKLLCTLTFLVFSLLYFCGEFWFTNHHHIKLIIIRSKPEKRIGHLSQHITYRTYTIHSTSSWRNNPSSPPLTTMLGNRRKDIHQYRLYLSRSSFSD